MAADGQRIACAQPRQQLALGGGDDRAHRPQGIVQIETQDEGTIHGHILAQRGPRFRGFWPSRATICLAHPSKENTQWLLTAFHSPWLGCASAPPQPPPLPQLPPPRPPLPQPPPASRPRSARSL